MTPPERRLWGVLRDSPGHYRFRKQHPCGPYTLDFFCELAGLVIEVDGEAHERGDRPARDEVRDAWLAAQGFATLRIPAVELLRDIDAVVRYIVDTAASRCPHHHPATPDGPPPPLTRGRSLE